MRGRFHSEAVLGGEQLSGNEQQPRLSPTHTSILRRVNEFGGVERPSLSKRCATWNVELTNSLV